MRPKTNSSNTQHKITACVITCWLLAIAFGVFIAAALIGWAGLHGIVAAVCGIIVILMTGWCLAGMLCAFNVPAVAIDTKTATAARADTVAASARKKTAVKAEPKKTKAVSEIRSDDSELYLQAQNELENNKRSKALWAKVMTLCMGDEVKAKYQYISIRVEEQKRAMSKKAKAKTEAMAEVEAEAKTHAQADANSLAARRIQQRKRDTKLKADRAEEKPRTKAQADAGSLVSRAIVQKIREAELTADEQKADKLKADKLKSQADRSKLLLEWLEADQIANKLKADKLKADRAEAKPITKAQTDANLLVSRTIVQKTREAELTADAQLTDDRVKADKVKAEAQVESDRNEEVRAKLAKSLFG